MWHDLVRLRTSLAEATRVEPCARPADQWHLADGVLRHAVTDFFEVAGFAHADGGHRVLLRQRETALVGLLVCTTPAGRFFLLNARCEPGLHGRCQFSTTIQSTPSNYERRHGGAATPFLGVVLGDEHRARTLHDSLEYDWGQYYDGKRKRFLVREVDDLLEADAPCVWVPEVLVRRMLASDFMVTADLRSALALVFAHDALAHDALAPAGARVDHHRQEAGAAAPLEQVALESMPDWVVDDVGVREREPAQGVEVRYVRTSSDSREVRAWSQPLLHVAEPLEVTLPVRFDDGVRRIGVHRAAQFGVPGRALSFPAPIAREHLALDRPVRTSAEGGRFFEHEVVLRLGRVLDGAADGHEVDWLPEREFAELLLSPERTSVELRLAATLLTAEPT